MKKIYIFSTVLFLLFVCNFSFTQNIKNLEPPLTLYTTEAGTYIFDTVLIIDSVSKQDLYKRAKNWVNLTIKPSDKTVVFDDSGFNEIKMETTLGLPKFVMINIKFRTSMFFKENKCRIVYDSFIFSKTKDTGSGIGTFDYQFEKIKVYNKVKIREDFDLQFIAYRNSLIKTLFNSNISNW
jgi:hypothetical protein